MSWARCVWLGRTLTIYGTTPTRTGSTHVLLSSLPADQFLLPLLTVLLPIISSTLVVLDISSNGLTALPAAIARCMALEELNISDNQVLSLPPWMGELSSLRVLVVDGCGLKAMPAELASARYLHTICGELMEPVSAGLRSPV